MRAVRIEIPEETLISLKTDVESFAHDVKLLAAVKLFEFGRLSSGGAAQLEGMTRIGFLLALGRYRVSPFQTKPEELSQDVVNA